MSTDIISNMLSSIRNASMVNKEFIELPHTKNIEAIAKVLQKGNFLKKVKGFKEKGSTHKGLHIDLAYEDSGAPMINEIKRVSKPGRRIYMRFGDIKRIKPEYGVLVVSTSRGIMSGEDARKKKLGGEVICEVI